MRRKRYREHSSPSLRGWLRARSSPRPHPLSSSASRPLGRPAGSVEQPRRGLADRRRGVRILPAWHRSFRSPLGVACRDRRGGGSRHRRVPRRYRCHGPSHQPDAAAADVEPGQHRGRTGGAFIEARNATGTRVTISAVSLANPVPGSFSRKPSAPAFRDCLSAPGNLLCQRAVDRIVVRSESPGAAPSAVRARAATRTARRRRSGSRSRAGWWRWRAPSRPSARRTSAASCPSRARRPRANGCSTRSCS